MWDHPGSKPLQWGSRCSHTDLIYPFKLPKQSHPTGKLRLKTGKFPQETGDKEPRADRKGPGTAGWREALVDFCSWEGRSEEGTAVSLSNLRRWAEHPIGSRAQQQHKRALEVLQRKMLPQKEQEIPCFWNR